MARDNLLAYPDLNEWFKTHTNDSSFQLGAVVIQNVKQIAFYSIELTDSQKKNTVTAKDMLCIIETLK